MGWDSFMDKVPSMKDFTKGAESLMDTGKKQNQRKDNDSGELTEITAMLNDPNQGPMFEKQFGMDISGAKAKDGVVTNDETVSIVAKFSQKLVKGGYLKDVSSAEKKQHEKALKKELGGDIDAYNDLSSSQKDALLIFISTPDAKRQEAIQKAAQDGGLSYVPNTDTTKKHNVVLVDGSGKEIDLQRPDMAKTQAYTEFPEVPPFIGGDNDLG